MLGIQLASSSSSSEVSGENSSGSGSHASSRSLNYATLSFQDKELQKLYDSHTSSSKVSRTALILFYCFVLLSTYQYSGVLSKALHGDYGVVIATSFSFWILGFCAITMYYLFLVADALSDYEGRHMISSMVPSHREWRQRAQLYCLNVFILAQPMVHGCLIYGRTMSPRECRDYSEASGMAGVFEIMEVQMTCNTTVNGRIPSELTFCMGLFMLFHQFIFRPVSWAVIGTHWLIGFVLLVLAYINVVPGEPAGVGECVLVLVCFVSLFALMYSVEKSKKELFLLKLRVASVDDAEGSANTAAARRQTAATDRDSAHKTSSATRSGEVKEQSLESSAAASRSSQNQSLNSAVGLFDHDAAGKLSVREAPHQVLFRQEAASEMSSVTMEEVRLISRLTSRLSSRLFSRPPSARPPPPPSRHLIPHSPTHLCILPFQDFYDEGVPSVTSSQQ